MYSWLHIDVHNKMNGCCVCHCLSASFFSFSFLLLLEGTGAVLWLRKRFSLVYIARRRTRKYDGRNVNIFAIIPFSALKQRTRKAAPCAPTAAGRPSATSLFFLVAAPPSQKMDRPFDAN